MTHKKKPSYNLFELKELLLDRRTRGITRDPRRDAAELGYADDDDIVKTLMELTREHFCWSMTERNNPQVWQDVYKLPQDDHTLYIKLQIGYGEKCWVRSFKKDEGEGY